MSEPLTPAEQKVIEQWRRLRPEDRESLRVMLDRLPKTTPPKPPTKE